MPVLSLTSNLAESETLGVEPPNLFQQIYVILYMLKFENPWCKKYAPASYPQFLSGDAINFNMSVQPSAILKPALSRKERK